MAIESTTIAFTVSISDSSAASWLYNLILKIYKIFLKHIEIFVTRQAIGLSRLWRKKYGHKFLTINSLDSVEIFFFHSRFK